MIDETTRKRIKYLSEHFDDINCREELRKIIHRQVTQDKKQYYRK